LVTADFRLLVLVPGSAVISILGDNKRSAAQALVESAQAVEHEFAPSAIVIRVGETGVASLASSLGHTMIPGESEKVTPRDGVPRLKPASSFLRYGCLTIAAALAIGCALLLTYITAIRSRHMKWYHAVERRIVELADKRLEGVTPEQWAYCLDTTWNLHVNFGAYDYFDPKRRDEFLAEFGRRLARPIDLATIDWIWDQYVEHAHARHYSESYRPTDPVHLRQFAAGQHGDGPHLWEWLDQLRLAKAYATPDSLARIGWKLVALNLVVKEAPRGTPLEGAIVVLEHPNYGKHRAVTNADGRAYFKVMLRTVEIGDIWRRKVLTETTDWAIRVLVKDDDPLEKKLEAYIGNMLTASDNDPHEFTISVTVKRDTPRN
jgi:hypothetical protein